MVSQSALKAFLVQITALGKSHYICIKYKNMKKIIITGALALAAATVGTFNGAQQAQGEEKVFAQRNNQVVRFFAQENGRFVRVNPRNNRLRANRRNLGRAAQFTARVLSNNLVAFRSNLTNRYVSSENGRRAMRANRNRIGSQERFRVENARRAISGFRGRALTVRGNNNRFVSSEGGRRAMRCNRRSAGISELFNEFNQRPGGFAR